MTGYEWWWSWLLTLPQLFAYWQVGNLRRWAWLLAFTVDVLWVVYSLLTSQYGFLTSASYSARWPSGTGGGGGPTRPGTFAGCSLGPLPNTSGWRVTDHSGRAASRGTTARPRASVGAPALGWCGARAHRLVRASPQPSLWWSGGVR